MIKKKTVKKVKDQKTVKKVKVQKTKETKNPEKSLEDQLLMKDEKIQELEGNVKRFFELKESYDGVLEKAKAYYYQESIFSSRFSVEVLADTQKLFGLDAIDILY